MDRWARFNFQPVLPIGTDGTRVTGGRAHIELSRTAATEGMVLLKNENNTLPLASGKRVALFGKACVDYVKGGGGSGDVTTAYVRSLLEGMERKEQEGKTSLLPALGKFYRENVKEQYARGTAPGMITEPELPKELLQQAKAFTDTAIITICRFSGEGWDRIVASEKKKKSKNGGTNDTDMIERGKNLFERGDFYLSDEEQAMVDTVREAFSKVIVVLNVGGMVDTSWFKDKKEISAVLMAWQGGIEGGLAMADILCGDANPSGKLTDTFADSLEAYPSTETFHESEEYVEYTEDIYVGYRYFDTIPGAAKKINYPFGFGLSYTKFEITPTKFIKQENQVLVQVVVTNIGTVAGKEVVQLYVSAPQGKLGKPMKELKAFAKTRLLQAGEAQTLVLSVAVSSLASYDDSGKISKSAYVLEQGMYEFYVGNSSAELQMLTDRLIIAEDRVVLQLEEHCAPFMLKKRMLADGTYEELESYTGVPTDLSYEKEAVGAYTPAVPAQARRKMPWEGQEKGPDWRLIDVAEGKVTMDTFLEQLSVEELVGLLGGQPGTGVANTFGMGNNKTYGIPNVMTADGPAGLRIAGECGVNTTAWPCATLLACTFNEALVEEVGQAGAKEVKENNIGVWLTPAINIHRSPLCGRNFEYYSEDPLVAGKMAAAMIRGIQSQQIAASMKHFACNNKETNRTNSDSRVSERALREIYLKGFELAVKEADPWTIMTSYNIINGHRSSENRELLTGILRGEWGFRGMVTTDWWTNGEHYKEIKAGNDVKMACGYTDRVMAAYEKGEITKAEIISCAKRVLEMILKLQ